MNKDQLRQLWDEFIDYPDPENKTYVTTTSAILFAEHACLLVAKEYAKDQSNA